MWEEAEGYSQPKVADSAGSSEDVLPGEVPAAPKAMPGRKWRKAKAAAPKPNVARASAGASRPPKASTSSLGPRYAPKDSTYRTGSYQEFLDSGEFSESDLQEAFQAAGLGAEVQWGALQQEAAEIRREAAVLLSHPLPAARGEETEEAPSSEEPSPEEAEAAAGDAPAAEEPEGVAVEAPAAEQAEGAAGEAPAAEEPASNPEVLQRKPREPSFSFRLVFFNCWQEGLYIKMAPWPLPIKLVSVA